MSSPVPPIMTLPKTSDPRKSANETQVGGTHYKDSRIQHWDVAAANNYDYFQGQITKYVDRWKRKNGLQDLEKAAHFLQKYIEVEKDKIVRREALESDAEYSLARRREGA